MNKKFKLTGFARLFIFMLFFIPAAYLGASYYHGEDGIANVKDFFKSKSGSSTATVEDQLDSKKDEIAKLERQLETLKRDVRRLEAAK